MKPTLVGFIWRIFWWICIKGISQGQKLWSVAEMRCKGHWLSWCCSLMDFQSPCWNRWCPTQETWQGRAGQPGRHQGSPSTGTTSLGMGQGQARLRARRWAWLSRAHGWAGQGRLLWPGGRPCWGRGWWPWWPGTGSWAVGRVCQAATARPVGALTALTRISLSILYFSRGLLFLSLFCKMQHIKCVRFDLRPYRNS